MNNNNNKENERMKWRIWMMMKIQKREIEMIKMMIKWRIWTDNNIGESGARMISESLKTNTTLTYLDLTGDEKKK